MTVATLGVALLERCSCTAWASHLRGRGYPMLRRPCLVRNLLRLPAVAAAHRGALGRMGSCTWTASCPRRQGCRRGNRRPPPRRRGAPRTSEASATWQRVGLPFCIAAPGCVTATLETRLRREEVTLCLTASTVQGGDATGSSGTEARRGAARDWLVCTPRRRTADHGTRSNASVRRTILGRPSPAP